MTKRATLLHLRRILCAGAGPKVPPIHNEAEDPEHGRWLSRPHQLEGNDCVRKVEAGLQARLKKEGITRALQAPQPCKLVDVSMGGRFKNAG